MQLDERDRTRLNQILEGHAVVSSVRLDLSGHQARVVMKFLPDAVPRLEQHCRILQFTDLRRVSIFTFEEALPDELAEVESPSAGFMEFMSAVFDGQPIREWECFRRDCFLHERPTWDYAPTGEPAETTCAVFSKDRGPEFGRSRPWAMALWSGGLSVDRPMGAPCTLGEFIEEYSFLVEGP